MAQKNAQFSINSARLSIGTIGFDADFAGCISEVSIFPYEKSADQVERPYFPENECGTQQLARCDGFPCVDLLEGTGHHHMMSYVSRGVATVAYYDSNFVPGGQPWTCTCSTATENSLVGVWSCPGFYSGTVTITADYADDFTDLKTNDAVLFCKEDSGDCWKESTEGADLAPGQWTGTGGTSFEQCKSDAEAAGVLYFAWSGQVNGGYCKILNSKFASPNLGTNEGKGYKLYFNKCQKCDQDFASISTEADRDAYVANCVDKGLYKEMVCPVMRALMGSGFLRWKSSEGGIPLDDLRFALTNVLGVTGGLLQFFNNFLLAFSSVLSDDKSILHFLRLPSVANHGASSGIIGAATGGTISDSDAFNEPEFDMLLQHSSNGWFSLPQWGDAVNFFAGRRYDEAQLLCPAVSGFAGCNQWATNSVNALNGADFPAIKDQAECQEKCALNQDCTSYMLHPTHGCALYKTLDGCTGNHGWTGYQMHCTKDVMWKTNPFSWLLLTFEYAAALLIFGRPDKTITVDQVTSLWKEAKVPAGFDLAENNGRTVDWTDVGAVVEFMDIVVNPDAMASMDSSGPDWEVFQNIATDVCGNGWLKCRGFSQVAAPGTCLKTVVNDIGMVLGNNPHTIQVRLTFPDNYPNARQWILNLGQRSTGSQHWIWNSQTVVQFGKWGGSQIQEVDISGCTYLTTTFSGSVLKLYCDGIFMAQKNAQFSINSARLSIGTIGFDADFAGCISEVSIFPYEKSADQIERPGTQ